MTLYSSSVISPFLTASFNFSTLSKCCCLLIGFNESIGVPVLDAPSGKVSDIDMG